MEYYKEDLAYIHDVGYGDYVFQAAPGLLEILNQNQIRDGLVVDLGCGSGLWAQALIKANYRVLGIDGSKAMIAIARSRVPEAKFRVECLFTADIPPCQAVTSLGECINYRFDADQDCLSLRPLFSRIYNALSPRGVFIFDSVEPGQIPPGSPTRSFTEGEDWVVLVEKAETLDPARLTRRIISFRKIGDFYRRAEELHTQQLYIAQEISQDLSAVGFHVQTLRSYGAYPLPNARVAFIAHKSG